MQVSFAIKVAALVSIAVVTRPPDAAAEGHVLDLQEAVARTLERNPTLVAYGFDIQAQQAMVVQAELKPRPELSFLVENGFGTGDLSGLDGAETTLSLSWLLERDKREHRVAASRALLLTAESDVDLKRLEAAAETARIFLQCLASQQRMVGAQQAIELAKGTVSAVAARVQAGRTPAADLARADADLARITLAGEDIEHDLLTAKRKLASQWGATETDFEEVVGDLDALPEVEPWSTLEARVEQNPALTRYATAERLRQSELRLARAQAKPSWRLTAGVRHLESTNDQALIAGFTIPLARGNRNQGQIARARANLARVDADREVTRIQLQNLLFAHHQELLHSLHRVDALRDQILPLVEKALLDTQRAYELGRYGYFELQAVQAEVLEARRALVEASVDVHRNVIEIERLIGVTPISLSANSRGSS